MEATGASETSVPVHQAVRRHIREYPKNPMLCSNTQHSSTLKIEAAESPKHVASYNRTYLKISALFYLQRPPALNMEVAE